MTAEAVFCRVLPDLHSTLSQVRRWELRFPSFPIFGVGRRQNLKQLLLGRGSGCRTSFAKRVHHMGGTDAP